MSKRKILILYTKNPNEITNRKAALGSYIFCLGNLLKDEFDIYINGTHIDNLNIVSSSLLPKNSPSFSKRLIPGFLKVIRFRKAIRKNNQSIIKQILALNITFDLVLEFYSSWSDGGLVISNKIQIPLITVIDAPVLDEFHYFYSSRLFDYNMKKMEELTILQSKKIIVYNLPMQQYIEQKLLIHKGNILQHQNIDFSRYEIPEKEQNIQTTQICFIGSFLKWHKVNLLIDAFEQVADKKDCELFLVGEGMLKKDIQQMVERSPLIEKIHLTGFLDGDSLFRLKNKMHIGIMPGSNWYGVPNKIFEYGISGMAVIAPSTPAIKDVFGNIKGVYLFKPDDLNDLKDKLNLAVEAVKNNKKLSAEISSTFKSTFNSDLSRNFYSELINSVLNKESVIY